MKLLSSIIFAATLMLCTPACSSADNSAPATADGSDAQADNVNVPAFSADSAYAHIAAQTAFGPRVPGTEAHRLCAEYLTSTLKRYGAEATQWRKQITDISGNSFELVNIIGRINPKATKRILLAAHWDSRRWADEDPDESKHSTPIDGANDGASGVGVILEMARVMAAHNPAVGIDILFTDAEDSGVSAPDDADQATVLRYENSWCLGTQHWLASEPYTDATRPAFGLVLDMVGANGAMFPPEYYSVRYAGTVIGKIQAAARRAGTSDRFPRHTSAAINDDHVHLNGYGIPTVDIIDLRPEGFCPTWHTSGDNLRSIDPSTLGIVGRTVLDLIYHEPAQ